MAIRVEVSAIIEWASKVIVANEPVGEAVIDYPQSGDPRHDLGEFGDVIRLAR
jgi:hypothetical protein